MARSVGDATPARFVRPELRQLHAYTLEQSSCRFKLDQNEVPWDLPARIKRRALDRLESRDWARYPDFHGDELRAALAAANDWPADGIVVGNGSNELLGVSLEAFCGPGSEVLGFLPSFGLYEMFVRRAGARSRFLEPRADLEVPVHELLAEIRSKPSRPLLLCSPNNPTGAAASPDEIAELLVALDAPLLLDNAYAEFCRFDYRPLLERHDNLVVFRTFSKAWSLGGMRLGYLLANPALVAELLKVKLPYNLNHAAVAAGLAVLEAAAAARRRISVLQGRREQFAALFEAFGLGVRPSEGNFLLVSSVPRVGEDRAREETCRIRDGLAEHGVLVRDVSAYPGLGGCFRVGIGCGRALRATHTALKEILQ
ncbi:MAG: histidinol-phosphate transaminase [Acidobacteriota bacterium]|nr:histidinol-phosphate transaminase [Acidobacteriota bacterium]